MKQRVDALMLCKQLFIGQYPFDLHILSPCASKDLHYVPRLKGTQTRPPKPQSSHIQAPPQGRTPRTQSGSI
mgnify:FL=1|jgi:hypothetical protein